MNMYNQANSPLWQPLSFQDFSATVNSAVSIIAENDSALINPDQVPTTEGQVEIAIHPSDFELEQLKAAISAQAYQEGHALGQQEGFNVGQQSGYDEGYQIGLKQGLLQAEQQINEEKMKLVQSMASLLANFQLALNGLDDLIIPKLTDLALVAAQKMVGELPKTKYKQLSLTIKSLIQQFPLLVDPIQLHVNPEDIACVETILSKELNHYHWQLVVDPLIEPGGCKLITDKNEVDATLTSKWQTITDAVNRENT